VSIFEEKTNGCVVGKFLSPSFSSRAIPHTHSRQLSLIIAHINLNLELDCDANCETSLGTMIREMGQDYQLNETGSDDNGRECDKLFQVRCDEILKESRSRRKSK
jgi:hypothetical protein